MLRTVDDCLAIRERLDRVRGWWSSAAGSSAPRSRRVAGHWGWTWCWSKGQPACCCPRWARRWHSAGRNCIVQHGVDLRVGVGVDAFVGDGQVKAVRLTDGSQLPADLVVVGLGVTPATDWLDGSGLRVDDGVVCDATGAAEGVHRCRRRRRRRPLVASAVRAAPAHRALGARGPPGCGRGADSAGGSAGRATPMTRCPISGRISTTSSCRCSVVPTGYDAIEIVEGDPDAWEFVAAYGRGGRTIAVLGTISGRVYGYREAIEKRAKFPPSRPD